MNEHSRHSSVVEWRPLIAAVSVPALMILVLVRRISRFVDPRYAKRPDQRPESD